MVEDRGIRRIEALVDGVFAIAMTLLALELIPSGSGGGLFRTLAAMWPKFYAYAMGFLVLGIFWALHHSVFHHIRRFDELLLWLNILFLTFVALVPFSTAVLGEDISSKSAAALYSGNMSAVSLSLGGIWWYATRRFRLVRPDLDPRLIRHRRVAFLIVALGFAAGIGISFLSARLTLALFGLMAAFYIASSVVWHRRWGSEPP